MGTRFRIVSLAFLLGGLALVSGRASAASTPPTLNLENLYEHNILFPGSGDYQSTVSCNPDSTSTITFNAYGTTDHAPSTGFNAYTGNWTEQGTVTFGPIVDGAGPITAFSATFTITGSTTVDGAPVPANVTGSLSLQPGNNTTGFLFHGPSLAECDPSNNFWIVLATYSASITVPSGTYTDSGTAALEGQHLDCCGSGDNNAQTVFLSNQSTVTPLGPASVVLTPPDAVNQVSTTHTVSAAVADAVGGPVSGATVLFTVQGSVSTGGSCTTGASGSCSFTYTGPALPGADVIMGCADSNANGHVDVGEPCNTATKAWVLPATTPGQVTGGGQIANASATDKLAFGFNAQSDSTGVKGECSVVDPSTNVKVKCTDTTALVQSGTHAVFFGHAVVNGATASYRIDVDDLGEPGAGGDTFSLLTSTGYSASGTLLNGNIQMHK